MALTSSPFHPVSHELLPGYRDAYLRGDLSRTNTERVDAYLQDNEAAGDDTLRRLQKLRATGHRVQPVGWVAQQFRLLAGQSRRFRQRATALLLGGVLASGLVFASHRETPELGAIGVEAAVMTTTLHGRILDENGAPLAGATVFDKTSGRGVSTNAEGVYALPVPLGKAVRLQYGYGGYQDDELLTQNRREQNVTLVPVFTAKGKPAHKKPKHWWFR